MRSYQTLTHSLTPVIEAEVGWSGLRPELQSNSVLTCMHCLGSKLGLRGLLFCLKIWPKGFCPLNRTWNLHFG
jgi:hypothetical protein